MSLPSLGVNGARPLLESPVELAGLSRGVAKGFLGTGNIATFGDTGIVTKGIIELLRCRELLLVVADVGFRVADFGALGTGELAVGVIFEGTARGGGVAFAGREAFTGGEALTGGVLFAGRSEEDVVGLGGMRTLLRCRG